MRNLLKLSFAFLMLIQLQSCLVKKPYEKAHDEVTKDLTVFRIDDYVNSDTASIATIPWGQYFSDPKLLEYIKTALENNIDNRVALKNIESSESYLLQSRSAFAPTLSIAPGAGYTTQSLNTQFGQIIGERRHILQYDVTASLSWELDIWGKIASQRDARKAQLLGTMSGQKALETRLIGQVSAMYFQLVNLDEQVRVLKKTIEARNENVETTGALKDAGQLTQVAVLQSEALYHNARALLIQTENQIKVLENSFNLLLNRPMQPVDRSGWASLSLPEEWSYGVPYSLLASRPDILAAEYNLISQFQMTNVSRAGFYPSLRITGSSGFQSIDIDKIFNPISLFANVVGSLSQPLLNQRMIRTTHEIALNNYEIAYLDYRNVVLTATKEVSDALHGIETYSEIEELKQKEYEAYRLSTEYSDELLNHGLANYLEVLRAQENELNTELALLNAKLNKYLFYIQLYRALGGGWEQ